MNLRTVHSVTAHRSMGARSFLSRSALSPGRSDYIISNRLIRVWRVVSEDSALITNATFPADCPHLADCHCHRVRGEYRRMHRVFQHIARFVLGTTVVQFYSYGRRLLGLPFRASPCG